MNVNTGEIVAERTLSNMSPEEKSKYKRVKTQNLPLAIQSEIEMHPERERFKRKVGVNEKCPCGSGKKFKKCCMEL